MRRTPETGHAKNVSNLEVLRDRCLSYGSAFNPSRDDMRIDALNVVLERTRATLDPVKITYSALTLAVAKREAEMAPLNKLITRSKQTLFSSTSSSEVDERAAALVRKIRGVRTSAGPEPAQVGVESEPEVSSHRATHMAYDTRVENFGQYIKLLAGTPEYKPNEKELSVAALEAWRDKFVGHNAEVRACLIAYDRARSARDQALYDPLTGLVPLAIDTKAYLCGAFGRQSPEYREVARLQFRHKR